MEKDWPGGIRDRSATSMSTAASTDNNARELEGEIFDRDVRDAVRLQQKASGGYRMELESEEQTQLGIAERGKDMLLVRCRFSVSVFQFLPSFLL